MAILLEHDPTVIDYCEQAIELKWSKSTWIPDFVVLLKNGNEYIILIIEVKYLTNLLENKKEFEHKYSDTELWIEQNKNSILQQLTDKPIKRVEFLVVTDQIINQSFRINNCRKFIQAYTEPSVYIEIKKHIRAILTKRPKIILKDLVEMLELKQLPEEITENEIWTTIYSMIYDFELYINYEALFNINSPLFSPDVFECKFESSETWFKKYNWKKQSNINPEVISYTDLYGISKDPKKSIELWEEANYRLKIIEPLLNKPVSDLKQIDFKKDGKTLNWQTIYRWILTYRKNDGDIRRLIPNYSQRGRKNLKNSITEELWKYGMEQYLQMERKSMKRAFEIMQAYANDNKQLNKCMSYPTFRRRIKNLDGREVMKKRIGKRNAEKDYELSESEFPHGDYALQSVQIDHTPIDVLVVDNEHRLVTEKPYLTVAFDSHTRCVLGYYITYDTPSRLSIAMTILNCLSNKKQSIKKVRMIFPDLNPKKLNLLEETEWSNVYGLPYTLHMDNGSDFTSDDIKLFGLAYQVHLHYRAVGKAQHGAYVERYLGTLNKRLHTVAGTTFSNVLERKDYPSEKRATYTIDELEARIITEIVLYHEEYHSQIKTTPLAKWRESFSPRNKERSINRNLSHVNPDKIILDIIPSEMRTVQKGGVEIFSLQYANKKIEKYIGIKDPNNARRSRKFRIRYDPRDIRSIYFYDESIQEYIELRCNDKMIQKYFRDKILSLWDWRAINTYMVIQGKKEEKIKTKLSLISLQQEMDKKAAERTKSSRQRVARRQRRTNDRNQSFSEVDLKMSKSKENPIDPSVFAVKQPKNIKTIQIPSGKANPFYKITKKNIIDKAHSLDKII